MGTRGEAIPLTVSRGLVADISKDANAGYVAASTYTRLASTTNDLLIEPCENVTIGCDPELFVVDTTTWNIVVPSPFFEQQGQIGRDGLMVELRPDYSTNTTKVLNNLRNLLRAAHSRIKQFSQNYELFARSFYADCNAGFHIHIGFPKEMIIFGRKGKTLNTAIARILDYYIGVLCTACEGADDFDRRVSPYTNYGKVGNYRLTPETFEYRVPGSNMLRHPVLTAGLLEAAKVVATDIVATIKHLTNGDLTKAYLLDGTALCSNVISTLELHNIICVENPSAAIALIPEIQDKYKKMVLYDQASILETFFSSIGNRYDYLLSENWMLGETIAYGGVQ